MPRFLFLSACAAASAILAPPAFAQTSPAPPTAPSTAPRLFLELPAEANTPDGLGLAPDGTLVLSVPNFNNDHLSEAGLDLAPAPPFMGAIDGQDRFSTWYDFKPEDLNPDTGRVGPMDNAFGPDGNLYVADMQVFFSKDHKSRILRIEVKDGKAVRADVVAEGLIAANGVYWMGDTLYVTDSVIVDPNTQPDGAPLVSGVYALTLDELSGDEPVRIAPYDPENRDPHLVQAFTSSGRMGFGADGVTGDDRGDLYVSVIEDATIYRLTPGRNGQEAASTVFARDAAMQSADGIIYDPARQQFLTADFLGNAVHRIDRQGRVTTLHRNGDSDGADGSFDQPAEVILRGDQLIVVNMDMAWATPGLSVNTRIDDRSNLSVIDLAPR